MKTYTLLCPDPNCKTTFTAELSPERLSEGADPISCPACGEEWEWEQDDATGALTLLLPEDELDENDELDDEEEEDDEG